MMSLSILRPRLDKQGTGLHPADVDAALQLGELRSMTRDGGVIQTRLPFAVDAAALRDSVGKEISVVRAPLTPASASPAHMPHAHMHMPTSPQAHMHMLHMHIHLSRVHVKVLLPKVLLCRDRL